MNDKTVLQELMWEMLDRRDKARDTITHAEAAVKHQNGIIRVATDAVEALDEAIALFNAVVPGLDKPRPTPIGAQASQGVNVSQGVLNARMQMESDRQMAMQQSLAQQVMLNTQVGPLHPSGMAWDALNPPNPGMFKRLFGGRE